MLGSQGPGTWGSVLEIGPEFVAWAEDKRERRSTEGRLPMQHKVTIDVLGGGVAGTTDGEVHGWTAQLDVSFASQPTSAYGG